MLKSTSQSVQAILIALLAYAAFGTGDVLSKFLTRTYSIPTCLTIASFIGLTVSSIWILLAKGIKGFAPPQWKMHIARGLLMAFSSFNALNAIKALSLPDFYGIVFLSPIAVLILSTLLGHEKFVLHRMITVILGFIGVVVIVGPQYQNLGTGALFAFTNVACTAVSVIMIRKIGQHDYLPVYCFFPFLAIFLTNLPFADLPATLPPPVDCARFLGFGLLIIIGHIAIPVSYAKAPRASLIAPVFYTLMFWGTLYGAIFFDQLPTIETLLGSLIIIGAGVYMVTHERRRAMVTDL